MRVVALLFALVLLGVFCASAQAVQATSAKEVTQSPAKVVAYWTAERMREATAVDAVPWRNVEIRTATFPFRRYEPATYNPAHGRVFFIDDLGAGRSCSGTALTGGNESVVWTAGHCINEHPGGFFANSKWIFVPAYRERTAPYGVWTARRLFTTAAWGNGGDAAYDLGAAVVNHGGRQGRDTLSDTVGGRGIDFLEPAQQRYRAHGYPASPPFTGERMFICESDLVTRDTSRNPPTLGIGCDMGRGSSGGGWVVGNDVLSVSSYNKLGRLDVLYGPYQGSAALDLYLTAALHQPDA